MRPVRYALLTVLVFLCLSLSAQGQAVSFESAVVDVGNVGLTITNAGFLGRAGIRNTPTGDPSFEYPLDSGVEHLFEAGLWVGAIREDGTITVRTAAQTASGGYAPGGAGYEFAQQSTIRRLSTLPTSDAFSRRATSHQDYFSTFVDTARVLPGTSIPMADVEGQLGMSINMTTHAWNFPFTEYFVIVNFDIVNISDARWDSVYVGLYHDLVVRNVNTTTESGGAFFNKGGLGYIDSLQTSYAFNAAGPEELTNPTTNTYGAVSFLGAEWVDPRTRQKRFYHPDLAAEYVNDGYTAPRMNFRWWQFSGGTNELSRPSSDDLKYNRLRQPFPNPISFESDTEYQEALEAWRVRLRTDGLSAQGNWIGLTGVGPFASVAPGDTLQATFALVAALKPEEFQGSDGLSIDVPESRTILANNVEWARRTYAGEDNNFNGVLDSGEDSNNNGVLDRYRIPEPPPSPRLRVEFENLADGSAQGQDTRVVLYWDRSAELTVDPVSGLIDFEGYRIYRSNPGDDQSGNVLDAASLVAQYDLPGNRTGFNNGLSQIRLDSPVTFPNDPTEYWYKFEVDDLLNGWQYVFYVTAFDTGDPDAGLPSFESSRTENNVRVFPGTPATSDLEVGVYPNPYRLNAAWDGATNRTRRLNFYNLPQRAEIRIYTLAGEIVKELVHEGDAYAGDIRWYDNFSADNRRLPGGEHSWDVLSENSLNIAGGLYLYTVKDLDTGNVQRGKFVIIK